MKKRVIKIAAVVLVVLAVAGIIVRVNSISLALALGGYGKVVVIEEGFSYTPETTRWRVILAERGGVNRLAIMEQGFLGFWGLPKAADSLSGEHEGLEYVVADTMPPYGYKYGYDYYVIADTMTHTDNWKFATERIARTDWFFHGSNAAQTLMLPENALPIDSTLQIYQNGSEYVLHLCRYIKGRNPSGSGFEDIYQALLDGGCLLTE